MEVYLVKYRESDATIGRYYASYQNATRDIIERLSEYSKFNKISPPLTLEDIKVLIECQDQNCFQIYPKEKPKRPKFIGYL